MPLQMPGQFPYLEFDWNVIQSQFVAFLQGMGDVRIARMASSIHRHVIYSAQFFYPVHMVVMSVGAEDGTQLQASVLQESENGGRFAGINDGDCSRLAV